MPMRRLVSCIVVLVAFLCGADALPSTRAIASFEDNPLVALGFSRCDGQPCFTGIIPGQTSWPKARSILLARNFTEDPSGLFLSREESIQGGLYVERVPDNPDVVNTVSFSDLGKKYKVSLAHVLDLYGLPCSVGTDFKGSFWFGYPNMLVNALSEDDRSSSTAAVVFVELVDPELARSTAGFTICTKTEYSSEYLRWFTVVI